MSFSLRILTKTKPPVGGLVFKKIKETALGESYDLSLVFVGKERIKNLNNKYRSKNTPTDILSFPLDKKCGEIYINPDISMKKAKLHGRTYKNYLLFLFIHGLVHLKGFDHGSRMESIEQTLRKKFRV